jgi:hypothetical protein
MTGSFQNRTENGKAKSAVFSQPAVLALRIPQSTQGCLTAGEEGSGVEPHHRILFLIECSSYSIDEGEILAFCWQIRYAYGIWKRPKLNESRIED